jgi:hypothetical protein
MKSELMDVRGTVVDYRKSKTVERKRKKCYKLQVIRFIDDDLDGG